MDSNSMDFYIQEDDTFSFYKEYYIIDN